MMMEEDNTDEVIYMSNNKEDDKEIDDEAFARKFRIVDANVRAKRQHALESSDEEDEEDDDSPATNTICSKDSNRTPVSSI